MRIKQAESPNDRKRLVSVFKHVNFGPNSKGAIIFNLDIDKMSTVLSNTSENSEEMITILNNEDALVFSSNSEDLNNFGKTSKQTYINGLKSNSTIVINTNSGKEMVSCVISGESGWKYISSVPLSVYEKKVAGIRTAMLLVVLVSLVFTICIAFIISVKTFNPIKQIISMLKQSESLTASIEDKNSKKNDELKYIISSFAKTVDQQKTVGEELKKRVELLKKAQAVALQSQINPHFFHNTLETINWTAMKLIGSKNEVSTMIASLSEMLRLSLENTDRLIPLRLEIVHASKYIEIQKIRYDDKFSINWDISEEAYSCNVVKIMLQPLIENAIYYGIKPMEGKGIIDIGGYVIENCLHIEVRDNGLGMPTEKVDALNEMMKNEYIKENEHLGLMNVNQRLKLFFGDSYGISLTSSVGKGTTVSLVMPFII